MKYIDEYRDSEAIRRVTSAIADTVTRPWRVMEICGGQTHSIARFGLEDLLPEGLSLIHGPGCPVCVTPIELIDKAVYAAKQSNVIFSTFGDMLRVPGSRGDLFAARADGADVRIVYSPLDALTIARENPNKEVVFFAVGFETTAPANAMAVYQAKKTGVSNFSILASHALVPPAVELLLSSPASAIDGILAAGHVCAIMGESEYLELASKREIPIVITGFEPLDILEGVYHCVQQLENGTHVVENQYTRAVRDCGSPEAVKLIQEVFEVCHRNWRGIGEISSSGLSLRIEYNDFNAELKFQLPQEPVPESEECQAGLVLQGVIKPIECPAFGKSCTPQRPLGAPMVSNEGACSAYYKYRRLQEAAL